MKKIRVTTKVDGFRRCGVAHVGTKIYDQDRWSLEELERLEAEPMLIVDEIDVPDELAPDEAAEKGEPKRSPVPKGKSPADKE